MTESVCGWKLLKISHNFCANCTGSHGGKSRVFKLRPISLSVALPLYILHYVLEQFKSEVG